MSGGDIARAYAVLGLTPPVSAQELKARYRELVRVWHPDRYVNDPSGYAEAELRMRAVNDAYRLVEQSLEAASEVPAKVSSAETSPHASIDEVVAAINARQAWSIWPRMSPERYLSIGCVLVYYILGAAALPSGPDAGLRRATGKAAAYFWLPLYLIWTGTAESSSREMRAVFRLAGWVFMALPAVLAALWWVLR